MSGFAQILVPVDYSETSDAALRMAAELAGAFKGRMLVLHLLRFDVYGMAEFPVVVPGQATVGDELKLGEETERLREHVREVLAAERTPPAYEVEVEWGSPYHQIIEVAIERRVDLIVMGTHGWTGIKHAVLGSVAEKTVRLSPCPVLTVRADAKTQLGAASSAAGTTHRPRRGEVGRLMCKRPITIGPDETLSEAYTRMRRAAVRHLPVVEGKQLVGMLSDRDLPAYSGQLEHTRVHVAMTPNPTTVSPDVSASTAAQIMLDHRVRALPVVEGETVIGVLSASDILEDYVRAARG
jgi:universal stress protein A